MSGDEDVSIAVKLMQSEGVRRLPVVDSRGNLMGIVAADDIYHALAADLAELSSVSASQMQRERAGAALGDRF